MADINLNPPKATNIHSRAGVMIDALAKYGSVVIKSGTSGHADMVTTTSAGTTGVMGVVTSVGDPNNSGLFAVGEVVDVRDQGDVEILVLGSVTYARGDQLTTSTTAGVAMKQASNGTQDIIGVVLQDVTTGTNPQRISCRLGIQRVVLA